MDALKSPYQEARRLVHEALEAEYGRLHPGLQYAHITLIYKLEEDLVRQVTNLIQRFSNEQLERGRKHANEAT